MQGMQVGGDSHRHSFPLPSSSSDATGRTFPSSNMELSESFTFRSSSPVTSYKQSSSLGTAVRWMQSFGTTNLSSNGTSSNSGSRVRIKSVIRFVAVLIFLLFVLTIRLHVNAPASDADDDVESFRRPAFVNERPYITSTYYSTTTAESTLFAGTETNPQVHALRHLAGKGSVEDGRRALDEQTRLAVLRPFCAFDAEALPTTFAAWNTLAPCKAAVTDLGDVDEDLDNFNGTSSKAKVPAAADVFLFYSQTFADSQEAVTAVDTIIAEFNEPGGWSECFDNIYAIEANIPPELDLYIPSAQEDLYNWVNGPNRQFEAAFRVIQSGEWGNYDGFYLMEGDSIPIKAHWLDHILEEVDNMRPFAIMGAKYNGDKWDQFYEKIPLSLLNHINGNGIYNTSHPLLERLVGQLEVEAPCPYNSIPYDYRMSQMVVEGALGIVPTLAPKIMLNEDGQNITLSNNTAMFAKWWNTWKGDVPFKETPAIHNYAATNLIPRHLGPEYVIHGAKLYSPWDPTETEITLVVSEWFADRSKYLLQNLDYSDHPFSQVKLMLPPDIQAKEEYNETVVPVRAQHRTGPDHMDLCEAQIDTEWFMMTNSYHQVAKHVDLMFTPSTFKPIVAFTPATYPFCFKFPYCKEIVNLAQRTNPKHDKVVQDFDMLFHTETRNKYCEMWRREYGEEGEDLYKNDKRALRRKAFVGPKGPTATGYTAYLFSEGKDGMYKFTDRSLYGARDFTIKVFKKEEKLDSLTPEELAKRVGESGLDNSTNCECAIIDNEEDCVGSMLGCQWRPLFYTCHAPESMDDSTPICPQTDPPTMAPTPAIDGSMEDTLAPTPATPMERIAADPWYASLFKTREHESSLPEEMDVQEDATREDATASPAAAPTPFVDDMAGSGVVEIEDESDFTKVSREHITSSP